MSRYTCIKLKGENDVANLSKANITTLVIGFNDVIWAGTTCGLAQITGDVYQMFTAAKDGLASDFIQSLTLHNQTLWIGTVNGLSSLQIDNN